MENVAMGKASGDKIRVGIIGSAGYTGGEMIRILIHHPQAEIVFAHSVSNAGKKVYEVHNDLFGDTELSFSSTFDADVDVLFLCLGHGDSRVFLNENKNLLKPGVRVIDLSQDFRLQAARRLDDKTFVYGLPELNRDAIRSGNYIANPGCFATSLQHALLPLAAEGLLPEHVYIQATTGSTGAGQKPAATTHFSWRNNNVSAYKVHTHQHLLEVSESLCQLQPSFLSNLGERGESLSAADAAAGSATSDAALAIERAGQHIHFIPMRGDFPRGIFSTVQVAIDLDEKQVVELYQSYYASHPFTHVSPANIDLKQVVNTNKSLIHLIKNGDQLVVLNAIDNLLKGASGQAVQNMNLMFGLEEREGLRLKSQGY